MGVSSASIQAPRSTAAPGRLARTTLATVVGFIALFGVGASSTFFLKEPYNPGFLEHPIVMALHVVLGTIYMALAPFQFVRRIRSRHLEAHRRIGRGLVAIGLVVGATAFFISLAIPFSGNAERIIVGFFALAFLFSLVQGAIHVRARRIALHREWMMRAFAIGLAISTMRLIFVPLLVWVGEPTQEEAATLSIVAFTLAFVLHSAFAEWWIQRTRSDSRPEAAGLPS